MFQIFKKYGCRKLKYPNGYRRFDNQGFVTFDHVNIFKLIEKKYVSKDFYENSFKFAFVRNPWDRLVSLFFYRKREYLPKYGDFTNFCIDLERRFNNNENLITVILDQFYNSIFQKYNYYHKHNYFHRFTNKIAPVGLYNTMGYNQLNPQVDWIMNEKGKIELDFIGRFENLENDFAKLSNILGIKGSLPRLRQSKHNDYKFYYTKRTKEIVEKIYSKDIQLFNYEF